MTAPAVFLVALALVVGLRLTELVISSRHATRLRASGAVEHGAGHYPYLVAAHVLYYVMLSVEVSFTRSPVDAWTWAALAALFGPTLAIRIWTMATLGERWTTRVFVIPGERVVVRGPYRYLRHPNYAVVLAEIVLFAAAFKAWTTLAVMLPIHVAVLAVRIRAEEAALSGATDWASALGQRPRLLGKP